MKQYPFEHDGPVYEIGDDHCEVAYYSRNKKKYKRLRHLPHEQWQDTKEVQIDSMTFYMVAACVERGSKHA